MRRYPSPQSPKAVPEHDGNLLLREGARRENSSLVVMPRLPDAEEDVERALRLKAGDAHLIRGHAACAGAARP